MNGIDQLCASPSSLKSLMDLNAVKASLSATTVKPHSHGERCATIVYFISAVLSCVWFSFVFIHFDHDSNKVPNCINCPIAPI